MNQGKTLKDLGMKLHVPYNNDFSLINKIIPYKEYIHSIYLPCNIRILGSGRYEGMALQRNWDNYEEEIGKIIKILKPNGILVNMLFNSIHVPSDYLNNFQGSHLYRYLKKMTSLGLEFVTVANIELARKIKLYFPSIKIDVSVLASVDSVKRAEYWKEVVNPDMICIDLDKGKDIELIRSVQNITGIPVKVLVNSYCLPNCPYKPQHYIHNSMLEDSAFDCWQVRAKKPWFFYKGRIIPPYYLRKYEGTIKHIKITDRNSSTSNIIERIKFYGVNPDSRSYLVNDGVETDKSGHKKIRDNVANIYYQFNSKHPYLKSIPQGVFEKTSSCDKLCDKCNFCYHTWKKDWQVNENNEILLDYVKKQFKNQDLTFYTSLLNNYHSKRHNIPFVQELKKDLDWVDEGFKPVIYYLLALAFLELKEESLFDKYANKIENNKLRQDLAKLKERLKDNEVIKYLKFDEEDENSFFYIANLNKKERHLDLIDSYIKLREEDKVESLLYEYKENNNLSKEAYSRFIERAFNNNLDSLAKELIKEKEKSFSLRKNEEVIKEIVSGEKPNGPENDRIRGINDLKLKLEFFLEYDMDFGDAKALIGFILEIKQMVTKKEYLIAYKAFRKLYNKTKLNVFQLQEFLTLLYLMNKRGEAEKIGSEIEDQKASFYEKQEELKSETNLVKKYYKLGLRALEIGDYRTAIFYAKRLLELNQTKETIWVNLLSLFKRIGDKIKFQEYKNKYYKLTNKILDVQWNNKEESNKYGT